MGKDGQPVLTIGMRQLFCELSPLSTSAEVQVARLQSVQASAHLGKCLHKT